MTTTTSIYYADGVSSVRFFDDAECAAIQQAREADVVIDDRYRSRDVLGKKLVLARLAEEADAARGGRAAAGGAPSRSGACGIGRGAGSLP